MEGKEKLVVSRPAIYIAAEGMGNSPMCGIITHLMIVLQPIGLCV